MRIQHIEPNPIHRIAYRRARVGGGSEDAWLPILAAEVLELPPALDALIATSDLQGVVKRGNSRLLGEALAEEAEVLVELLGLQPSRVGILLCGDLYSAPDASQRGATGEVSAAWRAFASRFRWVAGVLGNHDILSAPLDENAHLLDGEARYLDGLHVAGIGGIIGRGGKYLRRAPEKYLPLLAKLQRQIPDILLLHQSPALADRAGSEELGEIYARQKFALTMCGHVGWREALGESNGNQVLNVDGRAALLRRQSSCL